MTETGRGRGGWQRWNSSPKSAHVKPRMCGNRQHDEVVSGDLPLFRSTSPHPAFLPHEGAPPAAATQRRHGGNSYLQKSSKPQLHANAADQTACPRSISGKRPRSGVRSPRDVIAAATLCSDAAGGVLLPKPPRRGRQLPQVPTLIHPIHAPGRQPSPQNHSEPGPPGRPAPP